MGVGMEWRSLAARGQVARTAAATPTAAASHVQGRALMRRPPGAPGPSSAGSCTKTMPPDAQRRERRALAARAGGDGPPGGEDAEGPRVEDALADEGEQECPAPGRIERGD